MLGVIKWDLEEQLYPKQSNSSVWPQPRYLAKPKFWTGYGIRYMIHGKVLKLVNFATWTYVILIDRLFFGNQRTL